MIVLEEEELSERGVSERYQVAAFRLDPRISSGRTSSTGSSIFM